MEKFINLTYLVVLMKFNLSDYDWNMRQIRKLKEFIKRVKKDADLDKIDRDIINELAGEKFK